MLQASCPACGAEVKIANRAIAHVVCGYCRTLSVRRDLDLESLGKVASLHDEVTPLQLMTSGVFGGEAFMLTGAVQKEYDGGYWSEWHADFGAPKSGWLAQAQGRYTMTFAVRQSKGMPGFDELTRLDVGETLVIGDVTYTVMDKKSSRIATYCGELPPGAVRADELASLDLAARPDRFATIELGQNGTAACYVGRSVEFDELRLTNTRAIDGW